MVTPQSHQPGSCSSLPRPLSLLCLTVLPRETETVLVIFLSLLNITVLYLMHKCPIPPHWNSQHPKSDPQCEGRYLDRGLTSNSFSHQGFLLAQQREAGSLTVALLCPLNLLSTGAMGLRKWVIDESCPLASCLMPIKMAFPLIDQTLIAILKSMCYLGMCFMTLK